MQAMLQKLFFYGNARNRWGKAGRQMRTICCGFYKICWREWLKFRKRRIYLIILLPQMNLFETFPLLKTVEIAKKFNSKDFLITMVKKSSQIFQGIYTDWEDRFYFNLFFSENVVSCTHNDLREIFSRQQLCKNSQDKENWLIDILGELYHMFLYQIYVQMHFPTNILSEKDMQRSEKRKFNEAVLKKTYERIHSYTINILYTIKVFGDKHVAGEMKDVKDYYFSLR